MSNTCTAVLIDTVSIQPYIFGSNRLKENIGASYIIENLVFREVMMDVLNTLFEETLASGWDLEDNSVILMTNSNIQCEIGYIGGGNALVLFRQDKDSARFIREFSLQILLLFPGVKTAFGVIDDFDPNDNFHESMQRLQKSLQLNKSLHTVNVLPYKHGIANDCPLSNEASETNYKKDEGISVMSAGKLFWSNKAQEALMNKYSEVLYGQVFNYMFTNELDKFGQQEDKGYVAVVHVDGNGIGQRFINCSNLSALRKLSVEISKLANTAMDSLIKYVVGMFEDSILNENNGFNLLEEEWNSETTVRKILPIRPIVVGGDDITFVCEGRLGVHLAEKLINFMINESVDGQKISACAGIAIVHTKYPFFRAYHLAEELTAQAKIPSRREGSWISWLISSSGFSGSLMQVQSKMFDTPNGNLYYGPYRVDDQEGNLTALKRNILTLAYSRDAWPRNKLMALRSTLRKDKSEIAYFLTECKSRGRKLPEYVGRNFHECLWELENPLNPETGKTPYYDIIELLDFYPEELLI